ncbi:hypothetical protein Nepgr_014488 [Nepenthes gracilis]|uniref:Trichome birefringence-like C-terminal domain-containing protein n=1 Tax=Nepenthes gracilis TaxID=150966 RepID=A0AAD3SL72_NEPGR|nr:hypothetical protein Nepgr_014488 [Nepenthes gracilis]
MNGPVAFEKGLTAWARWVDFHLNSSKATVFFQGVSPDHATCCGQTRPLRETTASGGASGGENATQNVKTSSFA